MKRWKLKAALRVPLAFVPDSLPPPGEFWPASIKPASRIVSESSIDIEGVRVRLGPWRGPELSPELLESDTEAAVLTFETEASTAMAALEERELLLEAVIDDLCFQMQEPLHVVYLELLDVTPPVTVGDSRSTLVFPNGYPSPKFAQSMPLDCIPVFTPSLRSLHAPDSEQVRALDGM